ncbi:MAG: M56 family metallopeptidase, partial [Planctomycetales bacterium]|nr:M56 family metallopeptidase [Planctomycetales bacterium]
MNTYHVALLGSIVTSAWIETIGWLLVHSLWQFTLVGLLVAASRPFLRRVAAADRYRMGLVGLVTIAVLPIVTAVMIGPGIHDSARVSATADKSRAVALMDGPLSSPGSSVTNETSTTVNAGASHDTTGLVEQPASGNAEIHAGPLAGEERASLVDQRQDWLPVIVVIWIAGVLLFSLRPLWGWYVVLRLRSVGVSPASERLRLALERVMKSMSIARPVRLLESTCISSPIVTGCFRSVILVPTALATSLPIAQLEAIIGHELAHVRRYDFCVNLIQTLLETLFFYHPAVWWLSRRLRVERENCCDDLVVTTLGDKVAYGRALLAIEEFRGCQTSLALGARDGRLVHRIRRLLSDSSGDDRRGSFAWICFVPVIVCLVVLAWATPNPQMMAEANDQPFRLPDHGYVKDLRWLEDDQQIMTVGYQGGINVRRWQVDDHRLLSEIKLLSDEHGRAVNVESLRLSEDGRRVVGVTDAYVGVWDSMTGQLLRQLPIPRRDWHYDTAGPLAVSRDGSIVVAGLRTSFSRTTRV